MFTGSSADTAIEASRDCQTQEDRPLLRSFPRQTLSVASLDPCLPFLSLAERRSTGIEDVPEDNHRREGDRHGSSGEEHPLTEQEVEIYRATKEQKTLDEHKQRIRRHVERIIRDDPRIR